MESRKSLVACLFDFVRNTDFYTCFNGFTVFFAWGELPSPNRVDRGLFKYSIAVFWNINIDDVAIFIDHKYGDCITADSASSRVYREFGWCLFSGPWLCFDVIEIKDVEAAEVLLEINFWQGEVATEGVAGAWFQCQVELL